MLETDSPSGVNLIRASGKSAQGVPLGMSKMRDEYSAPELLAAYFSFEKSRTKKTKKRMTIVKTRKTTR